MKILYIVSGLKMGGVQRIATHVSREHAKQGHEVHLLTLESAIILESDPTVKIHSLEKKTLFSSNPLWAIYWILYKLFLRNIIPKSEFIWAQFLYSRLYRKKLAELEGDGEFDIIFLRGTRSIKYLHSVQHKGCIYSLHGTLTWLHENHNLISRKYFTWLHHWVFDGKNVFFVSRELEEHFLEQAERAGTQLAGHQVINNPCDLERIEKLKQEPLNFNTPFIVSVGRLTKQKRYDILLRAYALVDTDYKLVLIGTGSQESKLKKLSMKLGLNDRVVFTGLDSNPYRWITRAKMFVLSSDFEGFPNVLVEAVACQTPIVATRVQGASDILVGNMSKGLVDIGDINGLARTIEDYLRNPVTPDTAEVKRFSIEICAQKYIAAAINQSAIATTSIH